MVGRRRRPDIRLRFIHRVRFCHAVLLACREVVRRDAVKVAERHFAALVAQQIRRMVQPLAHFLPPAVGHKPRRALHHLVALAVCKPVGQLTRGVDFGLPEAGGFAAAIVVQKLAARSR